VNGECGDDVSSNVAIVEAAGAFEKLCAPQRSKYMQMAYYAPPTMWA